MATVSSPRGRSECGSAADPASSLFTVAPGKLLRPTGKGDGHDDSSVQTKNVEHGGELHPGFAPLAHRGGGWHNARTGKQANAILSKTRAADGHYPLPLPSLSHQPTMPPNSSRSNGSSPAISSLPPDAGNRSAQASGAADRPESGVSFSRPPFHWRRQMPERWGGDQLREAGMLR